MQKLFSQEIRFKDEDGMPTFPDWEERCSRWSLGDLTEPRKRRAVLKVTGNLKEFRWTGMEKRLV